MCSKGCLSVCVCRRLFWHYRLQGPVSDTSGYASLKNKGRFSLSDCVQERQTGTVADCVAWPNPSISGDHAYARCDQRGMLAHLDLIRLLCVPCRHNEPPRRACIDSRMLSTTIASPCQTLRERVVGDRW